MPFGLKNAGATCQSLVDTIFDGQIGRNIEAYVDDIVIVELVPLGLNKVVSFKVVCRDLNIVPVVTFFRIFQCLCKQGDWFSFSKRRNTDDVCMDDGPSSLKKWKDNFFLIDHKSVLDYLTWRHSCSCVSNDLPSNGYDRNDVQKLHARLIHLCEMREEVLVRSDLSSVWFNEECDLVFRRIDDNANRLGNCNFYSLFVVSFYMCFTNVLPFHAEMSIYDFMTLPSWSDAKIVKESHHLSLPLLERVSSHTTAPAAEGAMVPLPTPDEIVASLSDPRLAKKKLKRKASEVDSNAPKLGQAEDMDDAELINFYAEIEDSLENNEGASTRVASAPIPCLGKRLGAPPFMDVVSASEPSHVGTSAHASISWRSLSLEGAAVSDHTGKSEAEIPDDDFGTTTRGEEIDLIVFPLTLGPYHMPCLYEGVSSPLYTKKEWDGPHVMKCNILCKDIFTDSDVCGKALDRTITPAELRRTESLLPLE
nr:hypothetical protein [Tanacetum cinerariifolium]